MTRLEMQERIGAGPYDVSYITDDDGVECNWHIVDAHEQTVATAPDDADEEGLDTMLAICDALNALWESAK